MSEQRGGNGGYALKREVKDAAPGAAGGQGESPAVPNSTPTYYTVRDVARLLSAHEGTVRRWISEGKLSCVRLGPGPRPSIRVTKEQVGAFCLANPC